MRVSLLLPSNGFHHHDDDHEHAVAAFEWMIMIISLRALVTVAVWVCRSAAAEEEGTVGGVTRAEWETQEATPQ